MSQEFSSMIPKQPTEHNGFEERGTDEQLAKLYASLALARSQFGVIRRDETVRVKMTNGGSYEFKYAPMENLLSATTQPLTANGLVMLTPYTRTSGKCVQWAILAHKDGARLCMSFSFEPKSDIKDFGGQLTYYQRYAYRSILTIAADEDMDAMPGRERGEESVTRQNNTKLTQQNRTEVKPEPKQEPERSLEPPVASGNKRSKELADALRSLGLRSRAEAHTFVFKALGLSEGQFFNLGDPLGSSLSDFQVDKVMAAVVAQKTSGQ